MQKLLNVVNYLLLEFRWIVREHPNAGNRLFHRRFVATANTLYEILLQQASHTVCDRLRDRAVLLPAPSGRLLREPPHGDFCAERDFRDCSHSVMFGPPGLLATQVAPTDAALRVAAVALTSGHRAGRYRLALRTC